MTITTDGRFSGAKLWAVYQGNKELQAFHTRGDAELYAKFFMRRVPGATVEVVWIGGQAEGIEQQP